MRGCDTYRVDVESCVGRRTRELSQQLGQLGEVLRLEVLVLEEANAVQ